MSDCVTITKELLDAGRSARGSFSDLQVTLLGETKAKGWERRLLGLVVSREIYDRFKALRDLHLSETTLAKAKAKSEGKRIVHVALDLADFESVQRIAAKYDVPMESLILRALDKYCQPHGVSLSGAPKPPESQAAANAGSDRPQPQGEIITKTQARAIRQADALIRRKLQAPAPAKAASSDPSKPDRHGEPWSDEETILLCSDFVDGVPVNEIARKHRRTEGGIVGKLKKVAEADADIREKMISLGYLAVSGV